MSQKSVKCKSCGRLFLIPAIDTNRQETSAIDAQASFGLICPFCMAQAIYEAKDMQ